MGYNLYITRAKYWAENVNCYITAREWLEVVEKDPSLTLNTENGLYHTLWSGEENYWLDWFDGNIYTKYPDENLIKKMHEIAQDIGAQVHGEDDEVYISGQEPHYPENKPEIVITNPKKEKLMKVCDLLFIIVAVISYLSVEFSDNKSFDYRHIIIGICVLGLLTIFILERKK